ncbi:VOC family protein [candidate division KSB1 bacterium]
MPKSKYVHTNLVALEWKKLASFYETVFGCIPMPPERRLSGRELNDAIGLDKAELTGIHLRLPGYGNDGPTLEIFAYDRYEEKGSPAANRPGFGHIAFAVDNVEEAEGAILNAGGQPLGKVSTLKVPGAGSVTFVYLTDPEGNIIELQKWKQ